MRFADLRLDIPIPPTPAPTPPPHPTPNPPPPLTPGTTPTLTPSPSPTPPAAANDVNVTEQPADIPTSPERLSGARGLSIALGAVLVASIVTVLILRRRRR